MYGVTYKKTSDESKGRRTYIVTNTVMSAIKAHPEFRTLKIGDLYIDQVTGVPIGGYASFGLLHLFRSAAENIYDKSE
eukprot:6949950-Karenia_brevis.AAC.1